MRYNFLNKLSLRPCSDRVLTCLWCCERTQDALRTHWFRSLRPHSGGGLGHIRLQSFSSVYAHVATIQHHKQQQQQQQQIQNNSRGWSSDETRCLISIWAEESVQHKLDDSQPEFYQDISKKMEGNGDSRPDTSRMFQKSQELKQQVR